MRDRLRLILNVRRRELRRMGARPIYILGMVGIPLFCFYFFCHLLSEGIPQDLPVAVVDETNSANTRLIIDYLETFPQTAIVLRGKSFTEARDAMQRGKVVGIFHIPKDFDRLVISGDRPAITYYFNNAYMLGGSLSFRDMKTMSELANGKVILTYGEALGIPESVSMARIMPIQISAQPIGNHWLNYSVYLNSAILPGIMQLMILMMTVYSIGTEIKYRTSRDWLATSGGSIVLGLWGKLTTHFVVHFAVGLFLIALLYRYLDFPLRGSIWSMVAAMACLIIASQAMGVFFISVLPTLRMGLSLSALIGMLSFTIAGFTYPLQDMPPAVQALGQLFPLRHYFIISVDQALNGTPLYYSLPRYIILLAFVLLPIPLLGKLKKAVIEFKYIP